jgi:GTP cyclohydrolase I
MQGGLVMEKVFKEVISKLLEEREYKNSDENFKGTPRRVWSVFNEFIQPKEKVFRKVAEVLEKASFPSSYSGIVLVDNVKVYSLCPHHLLPVEMKVAFAYIPAGKVVGLSKIPRFLKELGKCLLLQEDYTGVALDMFMEVVKPEGAMIIVEGVHFCMRMRGVREEESAVQTLGVRGAFEEETVKMEVLSRLGLSRR